MPINKTTNCKLNRMKNLKTLTHVHTKSIGFLYVCGKYDVVPKEREGERIQPHMNSYNMHLTVVSWEIFAYCKVVATKNSSPENVVNFHFSGS